MGDLGLIITIIGGVMVAAGVLLFWYAQRKIRA